MPKMRLSLYLTAVAVKLESTGAFVITSGTLCMYMIRRTYTILSMYTTMTLRILTMTPSTMIPLTWGAVIMDMAVARKVLAAIPLL